MRKQGIHLPQYLCCGHAHGAQKRGRDEAEFLPDVRGRLATKLRYAFGFNLPGKREGRSGSGFGNEKKNPPSGLVQRCNSKRWNRQALCCANSPQNRERGGLLLWEKQ